MKQKIIETQKGKFLIVDLPDKSQRVHITVSGKLAFFIYNELEGSLPVVKNFPFKIEQPIGFIKDLTEEDWLNIIDVHTFYEPWTQYPPEDMYFDYNKDAYQWSPFSATESGHTLLQVNDVLLKNPIPEPEFMDGGPDGGGYDSNWIRDYEEAEEKVFRNAYLFRLIE